MTAHLRSLLGRATPGPWIDIGPSKDCDSVEVYSGNEDDGGFVAHTGSEPECDGRAVADAALIAALRNAAPALLDGMDALAEWVESQHSPSRAEDIVLYDAAKVALAALSAVEGGEEG